MSEQLTIALDQVQRYKPYLGTWEKVLEANGGVEADYEKPFPLSSVLDSNGLEDTLWCFRASSRDKSIRIKFLLFCIKGIRKYSSDKQMYCCINAINGYLLKSITLRELRSVANTSRAAVRNNAARAVAYTAFYIANPSYNNSLYTVAQAVMATVAQATARTATKDVTRTHRNAYKAEEQRQINYLRKLLDGEV